jgi:hypothetical protein
MRWRQLIAALALIASLTAGATPARADHTADERLTDEMPYILRPGEVRAGLWKLEVGLWGNEVLDRLQLGTYTWPWLVWATGAPFGNAYLKGEVWQRGPWSATAGAGLLYVDLGFDDQDASFTIVPIEAHVGYRVGDRITLAGGAIYTAVTLSGQFESEGSDFFRGAAGVSNVQIPLTVEWRWSERTALVSQARFVAYQDTAADGFARFQLDERTTVDVVATGESDVLDPARALALSTDFAWSWRTFNLRAGVTYGNYNVPVVNFVVPTKIWFPNFDLYWRF